MGIAPKIESSSLVRAYSSPHVAEEPDVQLNCLFELQLTTGEGRSFMMGIGSGNSRV